MKKKKNLKLQSLLLSLSGRYLLPGTLCFSPPAFKDNNFNVDSEVHFAFFKHGSKLLLLLLLN